MRLFYRILASILSVLLLICSVSCGEEAESADPVLERLIGKEALSSHKNRLIENETPYTLCFENEDGSHSLYVFSTPISFLQEDGSLALIDTELVSVSREEKKQGYWKKTKSSPVESYFPKSFEENGIRIQNGEYEMNLSPLSFKGDAIDTQTYCDAIGRRVPAVSYESGKNEIYSFLPTATGVTIAVSWTQQPQSNQISFVVFGDGLETAENIAQQYLLFQNEKKEERAIFHNSYLSDSQGNVSFGNSVEISKKEENFIVTITLAEEFLKTASYPVVFSPSLEWFEEGITDATRYDSENVVAEKASVVPTFDSEWGKNPRHYMKFKVNSIVKTYRENVKQASLNLFSLHGREIKGELQRIREHWREDSLMEKAPIPYQTETKAEGDGGFRIKADITQFIQECIYDDTYYTESYGLVWVPMEKSDAVFASYNSSLYQSYFRLDLYDAPWLYEK